MSTSSVSTASADGESLTVATLFRRVVETTLDEPSILGLYVVVALVSAAVPRLGGLVSLLGAGGATVLAYRALGGEVTAESSLGLRLVLLVVGSVVMSIPVTVGLVLLVLPGLYVFARFFLVFTAIMVDDYGPLEALAVSFAYTEGHGLTLLGYLVVSFVTALALSVAILFLLPNTGFLATFVGTLVFGPVISVGGAVAYRTLVPSDEEQDVVDGDE